MSSIAEIKKRLKKNWYQFINNNNKKFSTNVIDGSSPPSLFVGEFGYPQVRIGPMIPPYHGDTTILDKPELWTGKSLEEIVNYRINLLKGTILHNVNDVSGRYIESLQEMALSKKVVESTVTFEKMPSQYVDKMTLTNNVSEEELPTIFSAPVSDFRIIPSTADRKIEKKYYDHDSYATDAIIDFYNNNIDISQISKVLSMGMLGRRRNRKLVPTKWSITAADDVLSMYLINKIKDNPVLDNYLVFDYNHLANYYSVIFIPDDVWSIEMIESWIDTNGRIHMGSDYESGKKIEHYPSIAGAYFAAKFSVAEYLFKKRKKASVLILREIHPEYFVSLGVWQIREGIRECLKSKERTFESFDSALNYGVSKTSLSKTEWMKKSSIIKNKNQKRISDYLD
jgi:DNA repair protein NreA